ncbi:hypothetical protein RV00_GL000246 [Enterococcus devriesei]|uniref:Uncharacterized protein n=1 Tax=Enterococcus devriesei TaxID=319970 RepID=A0A1L8SYZ1_9ENTE|nr:hypothetical protein RV00_GL000246 [Enterococcus devriesei]
MKINNRKVKQLKLFTVISDIEDQTEEGLTNQKANQIIQWLGKYPFFGKIVGIVIDEKAAGGKNNKQTDDLNPQI